MREEPTFGGLLVGSLPVWLQAQAGLGDARAQHNDRECRDCDESGADLLHETLLSGLTMSALKRF